MTLGNGPEMLPIWVKASEISKFKFPDSRLKFELLKMRNQFFDRSLYFVSDLYCNYIGNIEILDDFEPRKFNH